MRETVDLAIIVAVYVAIIGTGWGLLIDPLRPATRWVAAVSVVLTGFLIAGLAPDAVLSVPVLITAFSATSWARERWWRAALIRNELPPRTPPPPLPSASANG
ncbi:hypothetical protein FHS07_001265 [Microbacterium proteolyticum]|uniref:Uncharacterized protein n=1 Tax=Microbacterium proteolyticum TaxID=1572644 RepID=A0A7W5CH57_9MICO|nr:hypothetical protein [Microbacterium proteolyticum]